MKRTITICLILISTQGFAGNFTAKERERCESVSELAKTIMSARQRGVSMKKSMSVIADQGGNELAERMVGNAYERPNYSTSEMEQRTIQDFSDRWYSMCYQVLSGDN